jgi:hypothetical protein
MDDLGILCFAPYPEADFSGEELDEIELAQIGHRCVDGYAFLMS